MTTAQWIRFAVEVVVDIVTGRLEGPGKASTPAVGLPHKHSELQAKASREAGPPCTLSPDGLRCTRMRGHGGPCAAEPVATGKPERGPPR